MKRARARVDKEMTRVAFGGELSNAPVPAVSASFAAA